MVPEPKRIVVGVTGASGSPYAQRLLKFLAAHREALGLDVSLVFTRMGNLVWRDEVGVDPEEYGFPIFSPNDMTAPFASGSARYDALIVVPCSIAQVARVAHGMSTDLVGRTADVMLKERKTVVLVVRETPFSLIHLRNMTAVTEAGGTILPACPSFYSHPTSIEALLDTVTARILDHIGVDNSLMQRWDGTLHGIKEGKA